MVTTQARIRVSWIDAARAFAVLAVLVMHYRAYVVSPLDDYPHFADRAWQILTTELTPVRMPLLLFMSGLLASSKVLTSASGALTRGISSLYLNGVWTTVYFLLSFFLVTSSPGEIPSLSQWALQLVTPGSNLWFIWALSAWAFAFILLRHLPPWLVLSAFFIISIFGILMRDDIPGGGPMTSTLRYGIFFALGVYGGRYAVRFLESHVIVKAVVLTGVYVAIDRLITVDGIDRLGRATLINLQSVAGIGLVAAAMVICCRWNIFSAVSGFIGRRTLPLFVCHLPLLWLVMNVPVVRSLLTPPGAELFWPLFGGAFLTGGSLLVEVIARKVGARHLFDVPRGLLPSVSHKGRN